MAVFKTCVMEEPKQRSRADKVQTQLELEMITQYLRKAFASPGWFWLSKLEWLKSAWKNRG
jgi:hypothetical protein